MAFRSQQEEKQLKPANKILQDISQLKDDKKVPDTREKVEYSNKTRQKYGQLCLK